MEIKQDERIDDLEYKGLKIIQKKKGFCFGVDSVLLSDFSKDIKKDSKVIDLGTGTGILPILLCGKTELKEVVGVEVQSEMAEMAERSSLLNHLEDKFKVLNCNVKDLERKVNLKSFDVVVTNPPYKKNNTGGKNEEKMKMISKHEVQGTLKDFINITQKLLKDNGCLFMVHRPERLTEIIIELKEKKLEPKIIRFVYSNKNTNAKMVLIKAVKNAKPFLQVEKPLYIFNEDGNYSEEILKIYNKDVK